MATFHWADYVVLAAVMVISTVIGIIVAIRQRGKNTTEEYLLGDRKLPMIPVAVSLWVTLMSAVSVLGTPIEIYLNGISFIIFTISFIIGAPPVVHVFIPFFYKLKLTSLYEYLEMRYSRTIRVMGAIVFCIQVVIYMAIVLYAPSLALSHVTGLSMWISVLMAGGVCTFYTSLGGLRAVVYIDTFQAMIIFAGTITLIVKGIIDVGGAAEVWRICSEGGRVDASLFDFSFDPRVRHSIWGMTLGAGVLAVGMYGVNQMIAQRYLAVRNISHAQTSLYLNVPANVLSFSMFIGLGLVAYALYFKCDPFITKRIDAFDQMIPLMVMDLLGHYPGVPGLFVACIFSASLSTVSSGVNALALVYMEDGLRPAYMSLRGVDMTDKTRLIVTKVLAFVLGLVIIGISYLCSLMDSTLINIAIRSLSMTLGPLLGVFLLAMFFPCSNSWGAGVGLLCGLSFSFWIGIGTVIDGPRTSILPLTPLDCPNSPITAILAARQAASEVSAPMMTSASVVSTPLMTSSSNVSTPFMASLSDVMTTAIADVTANATSSVWGNVSTSSPVAPKPAATGYDGLALYELSYMWYAACTVLIVNILGLIVSALTGGFSEDHKVDPTLYIPVMKKLKACVTTNKERYEVWKSHKLHNLTQDPQKDVKMTEKDVPMTEKPVKMTEKEMLGKK